MVTRITDEEWDKLSPENFETHSLLRAVDGVHELRADLNDGGHATPPQLRTDLLQLHQLAMAVISLLPGSAFVRATTSRRENEGRGACARAISTFADFSASSRTPPAAPDQRSSPSSSR